MIIYSPEDLSAGGSFTFPVPFKSAPSVFFCVLSTRADLTYVRELYPNGISTTGFTATENYYDGADKKKGYIAIGRYK